jgi:hypothetical protein
MFPDGMRKETTTDESGDATAPDASVTTVAANREHGVIVVPG